MVAQEQALNTRAVAHQIYHIVQNPRCRNCAHIIIGCSKLVGTEYNNVASIIHRAICTEYNLEHSKDWWVRPEKVVSNDQAKILWNFPIQANRHLLHNRPDIVLINYKEQTGLTIDTALPRGENIQDKKLNKIEKYQSLKIELEQP